MQLNRGFEVNWGAMPLSGVFATRDSAVCMVGGFSTDPLRKISAALEFDEDLTERPEFATFDKQVENRAALQALLAERCATGTTAHWTARLEAEGILNAPVHSLAETLDDPQTAANGMIIEAEHPVAGRFRMLDAPIHLSETPATVRRVAPRLGEHNVEVLRDHGFDDETIERLQEMGVLG